MAKIKTVRRNDLLHHELCYQINAALFEVFKQIGPGHPEKIYQRAVAAALRKRSIKFVEQYYVPLKFDNTNVGRYYLDFLIEDKIILELKKGKFVDALLIDQVKHYLTSLNLQLALVACFTNHGVFTKRILNLY